MTLRRIAGTRLEDPALEQMRIQHHEAIAELQGLPASAARVMEGVSLADGIVTPVAHGLGRPARWVGVSPPRGPVTAGIIEEVRDGSHDRRKVVALKATGWGATITVDVVAL